MKHNLIKYFTLLTSLVMASCTGTTNPDETAWQDVSQFSWSTKVGTLMKYRTEENVNGNTEITNSSFSVQLSNKDSYKGKFFYSMKEQGGSAGNKFGFLPLNKDSLVTMNVPYARYALVAPLSKGSTWVSEYKDDEEKVPAAKATIIQKLSELQLEGILYKDVIVVRYDIIDVSGLQNGDIISSYIRSYAKGYGAIQTIENSVPRHKSPTSDNEFLISKSVLVETIPVN